MQGGHIVKFHTGLLVFFFLLGMPFSALAAAPQPDTPEALIQSLYAHHQPGRHKEMSTCDRRAMARYCDEKLTALFQKDCDCGKRTHEVCNLDWDPFYDAQDFGPEAPNPRVKRIGESDDYEVTITNIDEVHLTYEIKKTKAGWRIANIKTPKWDLVKVLNGTQE